MTLLNQADALARGFVEQAFLRLSQVSKKTHSPTGENREREVLLPFVLCGLFVSRRFDATLETTAAESFGDPSVPTIRVMGARISAVRRMEDESCARNWFWRI
ncbi:hypothetical protein [Burkholderia pseudomallei]|uniref:hypothetical protein n=1 Tax=Burkholderia pseudomallei TaxID=28450 RepID=UPI0012B6FAE6|nr:hypothetical protein [Burkholderia pseudomallei]